MRRLLELDALRGIAAFSVVLLHFHDMWLNGDVAHLSVTQVRILTALTPLYAGNEAVVLFFVLSGLVLALPFERGKPQTYGIYLVRRLTRIYGPYALAILLAVLASTKWHGNLHHGHWTADSWTGPPKWNPVFAHLGFIGVFDWGKFDVAIWSLIHEMRISLMFPVLWLVTRRLGTWPSLALAAMGTLLAWKMSAYPANSIEWSLALTAHYAGFFVVGILLGRFLEVLHRRLAGSEAVLPVAAVSLVCYFGGMGLFFDRVLSRHFPLRVATLWGNWIVLVGAVGIVLLAISVPWASRMFRSRVPLFLGRISYSLYLVHFIVLMALTFAAGSLSPWIQFPIYLVGSLLLATGFCLWVEEPFMRLGRTLTGGPRSLKKA